MRLQLRPPSLYGQLTRIASVIIIIPLILISIFLHRNSVDAYGQISVRAGEMSLREAHNGIEASLSRAAATAEKVASDNRVLSIMRKAHGEYTAAERIDDIRTLRTLLSTYEGEGAVSGIRLAFTGTQQWLSNNSHFSIPLYELQAMLLENGVPLTAQGTPEGPVWVGNNRQLGEGGLFYQEGIAYIRIIRDIQNFDRVLGYVIVDQQHAPYERLLLEADITGESVLAMADENGALIVIGGGAVDGEAVWQAYVKGETLRSLQVLSQPLSPQGWMLTMLLPQRAYNKNVTILTLQTAVLSLVLMIVCLLFAGRMYRRILGRIHTIITCMEKVQQGDLDIRIPVVREDELGGIERHFNHALEELRLLMTQTMEMEKQDRLMRIRLLRSQINPHFLYNTLNSILWSAMDYGATKVCQMIKALSDFYKIALQPGSDEATIEHELLHVQRYVTLQKLRGEIDVTLGMQVDDTLREMRIPNMLLQPLVENCFVHGFLGREKGEIMVSVQPGDAGRVCITVADDGIGMTEKTLREVLSYTGPEHSYGLYSIAERLRLRYGENAALSISSQNRMGCVIEMHLPLR